MVEMGTGSVGTQTTLGQFFLLGLAGSLGSEEKGQLLIPFSRIVGNVRGSPVSPSLKSSKPERDFLGLKLHQQSPIILLPPRMEGRVFPGGASGKEHTC